MKMWDDMQKDPRDVWKLKGLQEVLNRDWNPLGIPAPQDHYSSYMEGIWSIAATDKGRLSWYLYKLETLSLNVPGDLRRCERAARSILSFMRRGLAG